MLTMDGNYSQRRHSMLAFSFIGCDGMDHKSFGIVELESQNINIVVVNEKELSEIFSVILFAQEITPELVGTIPGYYGSSGVTPLDNSKIGLVEQ